MKLEKIEKFELPVIKEPSFSEPPQLSMDEYFEFVEWNLKHIVDPETIEYWAEVFRVDVPFTFKD